MREVKQRIGNITSSNVSKLMGSNKPKETYLKELIMERKLGRSLTTESNARPLTWGLLLEKYVLAKEEMLKYKYTSTDTIGHEVVDYWYGTPDGVTEDSVIDIKCPYTLKSFCELVAIIESKSISYFKDEKPEYYWQLVSNAILTGKQYAELIVFCPYYSELDAIIELPNNDNYVPIQDMYKYKWVAFALPEELPYILDNGFYKNLNTFRFEVPETDIEILTETILNIKI
jgi:hypothetical protein